MDDHIIVMTIHGKGEVAEYVTIQTFKSTKTAYMYIANATVNNDDLWVRCEIIKGQRKYLLRKVCMEEVFDKELLKLDDRIIKKLLQETDSSELAKALKGVAREVQDKVFGNLPKRAAGMLKEDMEYMGSIRKSDCLDAQGKILDTLEMLLEEAEFDIEDLLDDEDPDDGDIVPDADDQIIEFPRNGE